MDATKKRAEKLQANGKPADFKQLLQMEPDAGTASASPSHAYILTKPEQAKVFVVRVLGPLSMAELAMFLVDASQQTKREQSEPSTVDS